MTAGNDCQTHSAQVVAERMESLCRLIDAQLTCARRGDLSRVESLAEQADEIVAGIAAAVCGGASTPAGLQERLEKLYREVMLVLGAEREDVHERLKRLRQVKRVLRVYQDGLNGTLR